MHTQRRPLLALFIGATVVVLTATPAASQNLLDQLENRVRERFGGQDAPQPTTPPALQAPPQQQSPAPQLGPTAPLGLPQPPGTSATPPNSAPAADRPTLGMEAEERGTEAPYEIVVSRVGAGSAADRAGIRPGDVILQVDDRPVDSIANITEVLRTKSPGESMRIVIRRGDRRHQAVATFAPAANEAGTGNAAEMQSRRAGVVERPPEGSGRLGVTVENASTTPPGAGVPVRRGAVVVEVAPGSPADVAGIEPGNAIVAVDGRVIQDAAGLIDEIGATVPGQQLELSFYRGESLRRIPVRLAGEDGLAMAAPPEQASSSEQGTSSAPAPGGVMGGIGQALGGLFGGSSASPAAQSGRPAPGTTLPGTTPPGTTPPDTREAPSSPDAAGEETGAPMTPQQTPSAATEQSPATPQSPAAPGAAPEPGASPAASVAEPPAEAGEGPSETAERVPPPAGDPEEVQQLMDKIQAMQRRIDVLERRLTELEAELPE